MLLKVALVDVIFSLTDYAANSLFNQTSKVVFDWDAVTGSTTETDEVELGPVPSDDAGRDAYALAVAQRVMEALLNEDWDWLTALVYTESISGVLPLAATSRQANP